MITEENLKVLEIGCGNNPRFEGSYKVDHKNICKGDSIDISINRLSYEDGFFDLVYSEHVIEHIYRSNIPFHFKDVYRVLKPDGKFVILCPNLRAAALAYVANDMDWFDYAKQYITLPGDTIGEIFMRFVVSEGSDNFLYNINNKKLGGVAHQWGWDFEQIKDVGRNCGFLDIIADYDELKNYEMNVTLYKKKVSKMK